MHCTTKTKMYLWCATSQDNKHVSCIKDHSQQMFMEQLVDSLLFVQHTWGSGQFKPGEVCCREASCDL